MTQSGLTAAANTDLQDLDPELIGARLEVARLCKYPLASIAEMARDLKEQYNISKSTYYGHERGTRQPPISMLHIYSAFLDIPVEYFLHGANGDTYEARARALAAGQKRSLRIDFLKPSDGALMSAVNQRLQKEKLPSFQKGRMRLIVKLMTDDLEKIAKGELSLSELTGETLPAPPFPSLGERAGWWQIPDYDYSMAGGGDAAFPPGTICFVDLDAPIEPGKFVLVLLRDHGEALVRRYVSDRTWAKQTRFALAALNPRSAAIEVADPEDCLLIARIVFSGSPR